MLLPPGKYDGDVHPRAGVPTCSSARSTCPTPSTHTEPFRLRALDQPGRRTAGSPATITFTRPAAPTTNRRRKASQPADMMRHILGEDLNVGCVLSWGPCWYHQKQFFEGAVHQLSTPQYLMRYDVEVSGFPSSHAGHLAAAAEGRRLPGHDADRRVAELGPAGPEVGQGAGRRRRLLAQRLGPGGAGDDAADLRHAAVRRHRRQRISSSTWRTTRATSSRRSIRRPSGS